MDGKTTMTDTEANALLPCPHCGGNHIRSGHIRDGRSIGCRDCGASVHAFQPDAEARAIAAWNRRVPVQAPGEAVRPAPGMAWQTYVDLNEALHDAINAFEAISDARMPGLAQRLAREALSKARAVSDAAIAAEPAERVLLREALEALEPFAETAASYDPPEDDNHLMAWNHEFTLGDLRRARTVAEKIRKGLNDGE